MKNIVLLLLFACLPFISFGQTEEILPKGLSASEKLQLLSPEPYSFPEIGITTPPSSPVRTMAEWEEIQALCITWRSFPNILAQITKHAVEECEVIIITNNINTTQNQLISNGVFDFSNITFLNESSNSIWMRDYGPNTVYTNDVDSLLIVDWIYNRPRPLDDVVPEAIAAYKNVPIYSTTSAPYDLVNTGGNFMADGMGTGFASELILEENEPGNPYNVGPHDNAAIDGIMNDFMGIDRYIKMDVLPYDAIHHIDMHMKLLDEETWLVGEYPTGVADGPQIEANIQYVLNNYNSAWGTPYEVVRIQMPPDNGAYPNTNWADYRTYTNCVFVNKTLLVPVYELQYDTTALKVLRQQLPGYKVVGINCNSIIGLSGALHCITRAVGANNPLYIAHQRLRDRDPNTGDYEVNATIKHISGIQEANVYWTTDSAGVYNQVPMTLTDPVGNIWTANIPEQAAGHRIFYYVDATAVSGKQQNKPMPAPEGYWRFKISGVLADVKDPLPALDFQPIFPNPASAITCIPVESKVSYEATIVLTDMFGRVVEEIFAGTIPSGDSKYFLHANKYPAGVYLVQIQAENQIKTQKLMIK